MDTTLCDLVCDHRSVTPTAAAQWVSIDQNEVMATAASMVMDTLKKRGAIDEKSAVDVSVFKNLPYATSTISYTISNLIEEGVVGKTNDERFYYDDLGFKALETKFVRGYSMIFIVPIVIAILVYVLQKVL